MLVRQMRKFKTLLYTIPTTKTSKMPCKNCVIVKDNNCTTCPCRILRYSVRKLSDELHRDARKEPH